MTSLESNLKRLGRGVLPSDLSAAQLAQRWLSVWGGAHANSGLEGVGAPLLLDWCAGKDTPSNIQLGRMAAVFAVMDAIAGTTPLTLREGMNFMANSSNYLDGASPAEVVGRFTVGAEEAPAQGLQLARASEAYINESNVWLGAIEAARSLQRV